MTKNTIFITGAGSGIGLACARHFARAGWFVGAYDLSTAPVQALVDEFGDQLIQAGHIDVTNDDSVTAAIAEFTQATGGHMHALFNCAGVLQIGHFDQVDLAKHLWHMDVNFGGIMRVSLAALPALKATQGARVINMSSASADYGTPEFASYSATKFAVRGLTEALNLEWRTHGIHVCDIMAPFVRTAMLANAPDNVGSIKRMGVHLNADDVAACVWQAATGARKVHWPVGVQYKLVYYTGQVLPNWARRGLIKLITSH